MFHSYSYKRRTLDTTRKQRNKTFNKCVGNGYLHKFTLTDNYVQNSLLISYTKENGKREILSNGTDDRLELPVYIFIMQFLSRRNMRRLC